jgi:hypothetical protein
MTAASHDPKLRKPEVYKQGIAMYDILRDRGLKAGLGDAFAAREMDTTKAHSEGIA